MRIPFSIGDERDSTVKPSVTLIDWNRGSRIKQLKATMASGAR
jgi:hypothetical protein